MSGSPVAQMLCYSWRVLDLPKTYKQGNFFGVMELIFHWDIDKARKNLHKHRASFEEAKTIFNDPWLVTFPDESHSDTEERYISIGISSTNRVLLVVHAEGHQDSAGWIIRIVSCRKATALERKVYEEGKN